MVVLQTADPTPINVTQSAKCPTSIAVDVVAQTAVPMTRGTDIVRLFPPSSVLETPTDLLYPKVVPSESRDCLPVSRIRWSVCQTMTAKSKG